MPEPMNMAGSDRVDFMIFTLPVRRQLWPDDVNPLDQARFMEAQFDAYISEIGGDLILTQIGYPKTVPGPGDVEWEWWEARFAVLRLPDRDGGA